MQSQIKALDASTINNESRKECLTAFKIEHYGDAANIALISVERPSMLIFVTIHDSTMGRFSFQGQIGHI